MDVYSKIFSNKYFDKLKTIANQESESLIGFHREDNPYLNEFKEYLIFAKEQSALTKKRIGDLKAFDWAHFVQTKNELLVAYFIHEYLGYENITFDPRSYLGNGKGDLEITIGNGKKIFIEITSPYRRFPPSNYMVGDYSGTIKQSMIKKYPTLPNDERITLIIFGHGLGDSRPYKDTMVKALYGEVKKQIPWKIVGQELDEEKAYDVFKPNGFFQKDIVNLSAVGVIDFAYCFGGVKEYICEIFHNPYAQHAMPVEIFNKYDKTEQYLDAAEWFKKQYDKIENI
ncbi:MAG: hypothetical protein KJ620_10905 [Candidatus Edwardsbacteria bacterium]|nr:hypothetical protein [Candidatus Edwardsbacteria bacterium]MBU1577318.1 hypothetical protein [Candidatus Edwardsbacteria bacterium]MBU2464291.1 hypothetical protein [Candidatus Edwardsbacteria bacterium]MBU2594919.1 hypothetical protein [Candidatus Edwardsbacteria bacterium]